MERQQQSEKGEACVSVMDNTGHRMRKGKTIMTSQLLLEVYEPAYDSQKIIKLQGTRDIKHSNIWYIKLRRVSQEWCCIPIIP